jgi:ATP-dependent helicase/nuclease subunit A
MEAAEQVRLLYVAMTRAKERLVLSGGWSSKDGGGGDGGPQTLMTLVAARRNQDARRVQAERQGPREGEPGTPVRWVMPGLADDGVGQAEPRIIQGPGVVPVDVEADRVALVNARALAAARMARPLVSSASTDSHWEEEDSETHGRRGSDSRVAMAVGSAVHRMLELICLDADLEPQINDLAKRMADQLDGLDPQRLAEARRRLGDLVERLRGGACVARLQQVAAQVVARELPLLVVPRAEDRATAFMTGCADLIYRDPTTGALVVADYKTDVVATPDELEARSQTYAPQLAVYCRALREALGLDAEPRGELWFLWVDQVVEMNKGPAT